MSDVIKFVVRKTFNGLQFANVVSLAHVGAGKSRVTCRACARTLYALRARVALDLATESGIELVRTGSTCEPWEWRRRAWFTQMALVLVVVGCGAGLEAGIAHTLRFQGVECFVLGTEHTLCPICY